MELFSYLTKYDYEQVVFCHDEASGLKAIIAIHDTTLGPGAWRLPDVDVCDRRRCDSRRAAARARHDI